MTEPMLPTPVQHSCPGLDPSDRSVTVRIFVRQEPDEEEEEDPNGDEDEEDDEDNNNDGYSE